MADKRIVPYGIHLNKKFIREEVLALSITPSKNLALVPPKIPYDHAYYAQAIPHPMIAPPPARLFLEDKPRQRERLFGLLDPEPIKVPRELNILPPRMGEKLMEVLTNKEGDPIYAKYHSVKPRVTIDGVRAKPGQVKVVPPKPPMEKKKRAPPPPPPKNKKRNIKGSPWEYCIGS